MSKPGMFEGKKVLMTSHRTGFANTFNKPLIEMFNREGAEVHYASNGEELAYGCSKDFKLSVQRNPFKFGNVKAIFELKKIVDTEKYDLIHCHTPTGGVVTRLAAIKARAKYGTRIIYTAHGFHFFKGAPLLNWLVYYPIERYMARHTDTLITINKEDYMRAKARFKTNVVYVPGVGIDKRKINVKMSESQRSELRTSLGLANNAFVILYPAELNKNKNQVLLIEAMQHVAGIRSDIHLLLAGKDTLNGFHKSLVDKYKLAKQIHLLGYRKDIPQLLQVVDLAVSVSRREGLPVHIMEAMCAGLPIVASSCRGVEELVSNNKNGYLISPNNSKELSNAIIHLINSPKLIRSMGVKSERIVQQYSIEEVMKHMVTIYKRDTRR